jgi:hypothetical protein
LPAALARVVAELCLLRTKKNACTGEGMRLRLRAAPTCDA